MNEVLNYLIENPVFFIATNDGDQPHVRPFGAVSEFEGKLYICTNNKKEVFAQIKNNPKVEISVMGKNGDWLRVVAKAIPDDRDSAREAMLAANPGLNSLYKIGDGIFEVLYLEDATATFAAFGSTPKVITF
ncbi:MAG TPA: pyridoxamine 5'-phosphate oxidase family protein [Mobilitalea sp.]|nr:pyridoxamine 5'-phosphate oxidase family protein [Mobilitalea sp.]